MIDQTKLIYIYTCETYFLAHVLPVSPATGFIAILSSTRGRRQGDGSIRKQNLVRVGSHRGQDLQVVSGNVAFLVIRRASRKSRHRVFGHPRVVGEEVLCPECQMGRAAKTC